ncbi:hypothetical protein SNS2_5077 [Streptomyces netropsis]|uniref:Thymidylate kinase n=1 Tax=Streptomyces syringium TaxID=76729 RepID=A0ABS4YC74_9ACTN|nr:hypothetical protein [Streptomyces syringium]MBP2406351.1 thymidylate kinase [Streptomyces syringium]SPE63753.1 hypothetical protein SNS2_5077 [Streptomyces netropsis]
MASAGEASTPLLCAVEKGERMSTRALSNGVPFCVLLGPDHAGKSTVLAALGREVPAWRTLSVDGTLLAPEHALLNRLRRELVREVAPHGQAWSADFLTTMVQTAVVHLRDELLRSDPRVPAVVDSYYYKYLAKCRLAGAADHHPMFAWWRSFPRPRRVIYLDVTPGTAWQRCREGADLNPLEYYGPQPRRDEFHRYQTDLAKAMWDEIRDLPVTVVEERNDPVHTAESIRRVLVDELG